MYISLSMILGLYIGCIGESRVLNVEDLFIDDRAAHPDDCIKLEYVDKYVKVKGTLTSGCPRITPANFTLSNEDKTMFIGVITSNSTISPSDIQVYIDDLFHLPQYSGRVIVSGDVIKLSGLFDYYVIKAEKIEVVQ